MPVLLRSSMWMVLAFILSAVFGCQEAAQDEVQMKGRDEPNPLLVAASQHRIRMFGELEGGRSNEYFTRSVASLRQHTFSDVGSDTDPNVSRSGRKIIFASTRHNLKPDLYVKSVDGVAVTQLTSDPGADIQGVFSPDDSRVAFASDRTGNWDIWVISAEGGQPIQVTSGQGDEVHPSWSSDGQSLVYCSLPAGGGQWELWIADGIAGGAQKFIGYGLFPEWSPVGPTIAYQRARERGTRWFSIWTLTIVDGEPRYPTEVAGDATQAMILPAWSPDGQRIAFAATDTIPPDDPTSALEPGIFDIWIMNADGRNKMRLTDGFTLNYAPTFSPTGRVFFASSRTGQENVWSQMPSGSGMVADGRGDNAKASIGATSPENTPPPAVRRVAETRPTEDGLKSGDSDKRRLPD